jgi:hypothetical protein
VSINPAHIPIHNDPEKTLGKGDASGSGGLLGRLASASGFGAGFPATAELALGQQFLSVLEGEMGRLNGGGMGMVGIPGLELMDQSAMTQLFRAIQETALERAKETGDGNPDQVKPAFAANMSKAVENAADLAPEGIGKPISPLQTANAHLQGAGDAANTGMNAAKAAYGGQMAKTLAGFLSARFESGADPGAIGFDRVGGTSYGSYQIASNTGTMDRFLDFLDNKAPELAERLRNAGPANTGSKEGEMPDVWKSLAAEDPDGFFNLQHDFIKKSHLEPAARWISEQTGIDVLSRSPALAEVLFSTAVQHGPSGSSSIFAKAVEKALGQTGLDFDKALIREVYKNRSGQFASSTSQVQSAVKARLSREESAALALLGAGSLLDASV